MNQPRRREGRWDSAWPTKVGSYHLFFGSKQGTDPYPMVVRVCRSHNGVLVWVTSGRLLDADVERGMFRVLDPKTFPDLAGIRPPGRDAVEASA